MTIDGATVRHVARLAELAVSEADVPALAQQLEGIVTFVGQLQEAELPAESVAEPIGPRAVVLRPDTVSPIPMTMGPADFAPEFDQGFFIVPRLGGMAEE